MLMMRARFGVLRARWGFRSPLNNLQNIPRAGVVNGSSKICHHTLGNGSKTPALPGEHPNEVPRGPVEKRRSDEAGSAALRRRFPEHAKAKPASYSSPQARTHGAHALGDQALPDLMGLNLLHKKRAEVEQT